MSDLTISTKALLESVPGLQLVGGYSIPNAKASYALAKIKRAANTALQDVESARVALCEKHALHDEAGIAKKLASGAYDIPELDAFNADWLAIQSEPVTLSGCRALCLDELDGATQVVRVEGKPTEIVCGLTPDVLFSLGPLVIEGQPPQPVAG